MSLVEQPSRYAGSEINSVRKEPATVRLRVALAFPDLYEIGTSHFGIQILYHILNAETGILAERVYTPASDMEGQLRSSGTPLTSLETRTPIGQFDLVGFSLLYELNFTNILTMLDLAGIPFLSSQRDETHPLIIAGGPCTCNPEPVADFFDAMVIGDGERVILEMAKTWLRWKADTHGHKDTLLNIWSRIEGVYIPAFFANFRMILPHESEHIPTKRTLVNDLDDAPFPKAPIIPYGRPVHDRLRIEIARGCTRGCRFCQAGMIYRPVRERSPENLLDLSAASLSATGYEDVSLLSLSTGDYGCIIPLMTQLMARCASQHVAVSLPSLRAGTLPPELMSLIKRVRKTGFTIAPEAGSQRLRDVLNKNITEADVFETVRDAFHLGWQVIKLYFMVGLPTETDTDLQAIADRVRELRKIKLPKGRKGKLNVSVGTFIPKSHTPFQWAPQIALEESRDKIRFLQDRLRMPGVQVKWQNPEVSLLEGVWARGDRHLSRLLVTAWKKGCKFDGWSDGFQFPLWEQAFADEGMDPDFYTIRPRDTNEPLPWDHIDIGVTKAFLKKEWEHALKGIRTPDCRNGECNECGVCDFERVAPKVFKAFSTERSQQSPSTKPPAAHFTELRLSYSKRGQAKHFGHLEMVNIFVRAIRRAGIPVKYSEGFHPMPKIAFEDPLPIGMESLGEFFYMTVPDTVVPQHVVKGLNAQIPEGFLIHGCEPAPEKSSRKPPESIGYRIQIKAGAFDEKELAAFLNRSEFILTRVNRKGKVKETDLRGAVAKIEMPSPQQLEMRLKSEPGKTVRPLEVIQAIFSLSDETVRLADVVKG